MKSFPATEFFSPGPTFKAQDMCLCGERAAWPREVALVETGAKVGRPSGAVAISSPGYPWISQDGIGYPLVMTNIAIENDYL